MSIIYKIIPNTENKYKISNYGKVYCVKSGKEKNTFISSGKKLYFKPTIGGKRISCCIHRSVYSLFVGPIKKNQYIVHITAVFKKMGHIKKAI